MLRGTISALAGVLLFALAPTTFAQDKPNSLTRKEIDAGWILLFDGESLFGWDTAPEIARGKWAVKEGAIIPDREQPISYLPHGTDFGDFLLKVDVLVPNDASGSIWLRRRDDKQQAPASESPSPALGAEIALPIPAKKLHQPAPPPVTSTRKSKEKAPPAPATPPPPTWQTLEILCKGKTLMVKTKDGMVLDQKIDTLPFGHLAIAQATGKEPIRFRNIRLLPLGLESIFNGVDLMGWRKVADPSADKPNFLKEKWTVADENLHVEVPAEEGKTQGGRGYLETTELYKDFILQLQCRTNGSHLNSGVFFRNQPQKAGIGYEAQIRNEWTEDDRTKPVDFGTGGIYRRIPTRRVVSNDNKFLTMTVAASSRKISVWVDGFPVTNWVDPRESDANAREGYCPYPGTVSLQSHDPTTNIDFRNIRITELVPLTPSSEPATKESAP